MRRAFARAYPTADWASAVRFISRQRGGPSAIGAFHRGCGIPAFSRRKQEIVTRLLADHRADRTLVFTARTDDAYAISERHLVPVITAETSRTERKQILQRFGDGTYRAIASARVLNEGIDVPDARVAIIVSGALGLREHIQRIGRVLRPREGKRAVVYELVARGTIEEPRAHSRRRQLAS
jgi:superfamily II DNA or RNA helicase